MTKKLSAKAIYELNKPLVYDLYSAIKSSVTPEKFEESSRLIYIQNDKICFDKSSVKRILFKHYIDPNGESSFVLNVSHHISFIYKALVRFEDFKNQNYYCFLKHDWFIKCRNNMFKEFDDNILNQLAYNSTVTSFVVYMKPTDSIICLKFRPTQPHNVYVDYDFIFDLNFNLKDVVFNLNSQHKVSINLSKFSKTYWNKAFWLVLQYYLYPDIMSLINNSSYSDIDFPLYELNNENISMYSDIVEMAIL